MKNRTAIAALLIPGMFASTGKILKKEKIADLANKTCLDCGDEPEAEVFDLSAFSMWIESQNRDTYSVSIHKVMKLDEKS